MVMVTAVVVVSNISKRWIAKMYLLLFELLQLIQDEKTVVIVVG